MISRSSGLLLLFIAAAAAPAQVAAPRAPEETPPRYANTPREMVPFGRGLQPFHRFYTSPQPYRGPRAGKPATGKDSTLRVGLLIPARKSPNGARGMMVRRGVELAFEEANGRLTKGAPRRELVIKEDAPLWGSAANGMVGLCIEDRVVAVIGSVDGAATHVALRVALKCGVFMLNTATTDPTVTETAIPWLLRCIPDDRQHAYKLAHLIVHQRGLGRIAVLRANNRYGRTGIAEFLDSVRRLGHPVLLEMRYEPGDPDFSTQVARIHAVHPEAVVFWGDGKDLGRAARALRSGGVEAPFFGPDRLVDQAYLEAAGPAAEGTTATFPHDPTGSDPAWKAFQARFERRFGQPPDHFAAYAHDGARILLAALEISGSDRVRLRDALASLRSFKGVTGPMAFDPTHNNLSPLHLVKIHDGTFKFE